MEWLRKLLRENANAAISVPTILCFLQFVTDVVEIIKSEDFTNAMLTQLVYSANGFETVCLFIIMLVLKDKNK